MKTTYFIHKVYSFFFLSITQDTIHSKSLQKTFKKPYNMVRTQSKNDFF